MADYVVAARRGVEGVNLLEVLENAAGIRVKGDARRKAVAIEASETDVQTLREEAGHLLHVEPEILHHPLEAGSATA